MAVVCRVVGMNRQIYILGINFPLIHVTFTEIPWEVGE